MAGSQDKGLRVVNGGAIEGADRFNRETAMWQPSLRGADAVINPVKELADARGRDSERNDGFIHGAISVNKDSVIGSQYRLNLQPDTQFLQSINSGFNDSWAEKYKNVMEARFRLAAESDACWLDAMGINTFTGMLRLAVGTFVMAGEYVGTVEWIKDPLRPYRTAIQAVSPDRLCNPDGLPDTRSMRRGVERDSRGKPLFYNFRMGDKYDHYMDNLDLTWKRVPATKPWGRKQVLHVIEQAVPDQSRGISDIVSALKRVHMLRKFSDVNLQSAVINATYAATIESDLDAKAIEMAMGAGKDAPSALLDMYRAHLGAIGAYLGDASNIRIDGAMIPHLPPNSKLSMTPVRTSGGMGTTFEDSSLRYIAASLGMSFEAFSRNFSQSNYSSARASLGIQGQFMASRKRHVADRIATEIFALLLEEDFGAGEVPLPAGVKRDFFYRPLVKEALTACIWIGSGAGQIDESKETEAAKARIRAGLSTHAAECARLGYDSRDVFAQLAREQKLAESLGLYFDYSDRGTPTVPPTSEDAPATATAPAAEAA